MTRHTATADDRAFLRAIADRPDDDAPRLVYADYLDDGGDPARAELIRYQVAAARARPDDPKAGETVPADIAQRWIPVWDYTLPPIPYVRWGPYRRGFIDEVTLGAVGFYVYGSHIRRAVPLRRLRLERGEPREVWRLLSGDDIRAVPELWVTGSVWAIRSALPALAEAGPWPALRRLVVAVPVEEWAGEPFEPWDPRAVLTRLRERFGARLELPPGWHE